jgi:hypothetical protein
MKERKKKNQEFLKLISANFFIAFPLKKKEKKETTTF